MRDEADHTRRWLINASGAAILSSAIPGPAALAQPAPAPAAAPAAAATRAKLHVLDTLAAMVSGSRLKAGEFAARYVDSVGGKPQAMVIGTPIVTSAVNAAFANGMAAHADETDDTNPVGPVHLGCG